MTTDKQTARLLPQCHGCYYFLVYMYVINCIGCLCILYHIWHDKRWLYYYLSVFSI